MVPLLILIAVLQYRAATELSTATQARIGSNLQSLMTRWHLDFYGELSAICVALQVGPDSGAHDVWSDYLQRYRDWSLAESNRYAVENINADPELIENVYIWETSGPGPRLLRLNENAQKIENSDVPNKLETLLVRLKAKSSSLPLALHAWQFRDLEEQSLSGGTVSSLSSSRSNALAGWQFDANIPAIVHPILRPGAHSRSVDSGNPDSKDSVDWIVIVLNLDAIQKWIIPELARRYFGGGQGLDYKLALITGSNPPRVLYASESGFGSTQATFDSSMKLFGPARENVEGHLPQTDKNVHSLRRDEWRNFSAPVWFPVIRYTPDEEPWMLVVQRRTGSLEAIAKGVWRKNLIIGGAVLLLLAANMTLVVVASYRASRFAQMQMSFVASVSHELRTPLAAIFSAGENIKDGFVEGKPKLISYGSIITSQAHQLMDLVDHILLFASMRSGQRPFVLRALQVSEILQNVRRNTAGLIESSGFTIEQQVESGLPAVTCDLLAVSGCLQNLITNAIKYGGPDRWIRLSAEAHDGRDHKSEVSIRVEDHGMGIASSELPHVFDPFYRSSRAVAAQIHGTGLGLAVAQRIAEAMGGRLSVTSQVGVGSIFTLYLRAAEDLKDEPPSLNSGSEAVMRGDA
jgi:signal transduction histidine kinase